MGKYGRLKQNILHKSFRDIREEGFRFFIIKIYRFFYHKYLKLRAEKIVKRLRKKEFFYFQGKKFEYLIHPYNLAWINERSVEVPVVLEYIKNSNAKKTLELGAVLQNYANIDWEVVDKFESGKNIINQDIVDFKSNKKYDLIISISTLEHIGFDDSYEPEKIKKAINSIKKLLKNKGKFVATMPLGYNKYMDSLIFNEKLGFDKMYFMKRISRKNKWKETGMNEAKNSRYNYPYNNANAIIIGVSEKK